MIGERLRDARLAQKMSLTQVAGKARISAATLSRIENEKQALSVDTLFALAKIVGVTPEEMVSSGAAEPDERELADEINALTPQERTRLWRTLGDSRREPRHSRKEAADVNARLEELLAQVDFLREEILSLRSRQKKRR
jgi:transcriptional regulator with XRE-family HTH domain